MPPSKRDQQTNVTNNPTAQFPQNNCRTMSSNRDLLDRYKLESQITGDSVTHRTFQSDLQAHRRRIQVLTTWEHQGMLGEGAFGVVSLQRETVTGELRAVKAVAKQELRKHEMELLIDLQDVCILLLVIV